MSEKLNNKRIVIYVVSFVIFALLIVFLSHKNTNKQIMSNSASEMYAEDVVSAMPAPMVERALEVETAMFDEDAAGDSVKEIKRANDVTDGDDNAIAIEKRVIKTGNIDMRVNSVENAINEIRTITLAHGGDEVSSDISKNDTYKSGFIMVKVPVNQYAQTFEDIKKVAPLVTDESSQSQDVTTEFIDLESRIKNKKEHEARLRSFFRKAEEVDELIQVERELARVRTEIEQMEGQMKYLKAQTQYSTINASLVEESSIVVSDSWRPLQVIKDSFNTLIKKTTNLLNLTIRFTIVSLPFIVLFVILAWFLYFTAKHIFSKEDKDKK
jgi:uncharacterized protein YneF (UPF0154 family)